MNRYYHVLMMLLSPFLFIKVQGQAPKVLLFVSYEDTYYSEYVVMKKAFEAKGYVVDVRSAGLDSASVYMLPVNTDIAATAATLPGGSYAQFTAQFTDMFDSVWNPQWDATPAYIHLNGRIQDVTDMTDYSALIIAGGTGITEYRVDGTYQSQGTGTRMISPATVQTAAVKLNNLALDALLSGKPVLGQCHGASLPVFWRIPGTSGPGIDSLGYSLVRGGSATGYPEPQTYTTLSSLGVNARVDDRVMITSPHSTFSHNGNGDFKILTSRDWYPQTVAYAARTLLNVIETYPEKAQMNTPVSVLIIHGGVIDSFNCGASNRNNDIPCNHGTGTNLPADYRHLETLLLADAANDSFIFNVSNLNISGQNLPYTAGNQTSVFNYLMGFDAIIFFKHWSTNVDAALQQAIVSYADAGKGIIALHHGMYNDSISNLLNKNILRDQLFGAESSSNTWAGVTLSNYNLVQTNYGHFNGTFGIPNPPAAVQAPASWNGTMLPGSNTGFSAFHRIGIYDELYTNMTFVPGQVFGRKLNQITPLISNDQWPSSQSHTSGFVKMVDPSADGTIGRIAYYQPGERRESISMQHLYGQVIRNTVVWVANKNAGIPIPVKLLSFTLNCDETGQQLSWITSSENNAAYFVVEGSDDGENWQAAGTIQASGTSATARHYNFSSVTPGMFYRLKMVDKDGLVEFSKVQGCARQLYTTDGFIVLPNPANEYLLIRLPFVSDCVADLRDMSGRIVSGTELKGSVSGILDVSNVQPGFYLLSMETKNHIVTKKILISR